jgi:hypothetical protein
MKRRPIEDVKVVLALRDDGVGVREIARRTGISYGSVRRWLGWERPLMEARIAAGECEACGAPPHDHGALSPETYAYLLGAYLGDGCISNNNGSYLLRVTLDEVYPDIIGAVSRAIAEVCGRQPGVVPDRTGKRCVNVMISWKQWPCLLPQHGPGRKHHRPIVLTDWQQALVDQAPQAFLRGLIHTDGWRGLNRVTVKGRDYAYPRYQFSNRSDDIRRLFTDTCDALAIAWRPWGRWHISVARKEAVAAMDAFIGPKT